MQNIFQLFEIEDILLKKLKIAVYRWTEKYTRTANYKLERARGSTIDITSHTLL